MARYDIFIKPSALKELEAVDWKKDRQRLVHAIRSLAGEPRSSGCRKLSGKDKYRIRSGQYRIVYAVQDAILIVTIMKVAHRRDVYR